MQSLFCSNNLIKHLLSMIEFLKLNSISSCVFFSTKAKKFTLLSMKFYFYKICSFFVFCISVCYAISLPPNKSIPAVFVFGDSIVDTGNNNGLKTIAKVNYPPYGKDFMGGIPTGRFSNGKVPSDFLGKKILYIVQLCCSDS